MLVALMRSMRPQMLESFKDSNAQKEFLAKLKENKNILVLLKSDKNILNKVDSNSTSDYLKRNKKIIVYLIKSVKPITSGQV